MSPNNPSSDSDGVADAPSSTVAANQPATGKPSVADVVVPLIILLSATIQLSRILQVESPTGEVPFLSANDRSRWCTIATLVVNGSYHLDPVLEIRDPKTRRRTWYTIDLVRHRSSDGQQHYFSSKPPLLPTMYAGVYWLVRGTTGATLTQHPFFVARIMLVLVNLVPLVAWWFLLLRWFRRYALDDWARIVLALFICSGTFLSTFVVTLNNHLPAAMVVGISLWCLDRILVQQDGRWRWFALCGLCTSFGAANELPALSWLCAAGAMLLIVNWRAALMAYVPALLPVGIAFFGINYIAHGELAPAYAHRSAGAKICDLEPGDRVPVAPQVVRQLRGVGQEVSDQSIVREARRPETMELWDPVHERRFALKKSSDANGTLWAVHQWGDWYDYEGSYWNGKQQGVDLGEPNRWWYIFHCLVGHHGIFSLTPFWCLALAGTVCLWRDRETWNVFRDHQLMLTVAVVATSVVVVGFYFARGVEDRNYGGVSSGFRWTFWLIPLWLWLSVHVLRQINSAGWRQGVHVLVITSVFSASLPWTNPWTNPWPMRFGEYLQRDSVESSATSLDRSTIPFTSQVLPPRGSRPAG